MNILNSADTAATINLITRNARGTTTTSDGATSAGLTAKENLSHLISGGFDMPHPTSVFEGVPPFTFISNGTPLANWIIYGNTGGVGDKIEITLDAPLNGIRIYKDTLSLSTGKLTRKIKKLVLTGEETGWTKASSDSVFYNSAIVNDADNSASTITILCSHYAAQINVSTVSNVDDLKCCFRTTSKTLYIADSNFSTNTEFVTYLQQQNANNTPVTIWYVLSEPTETTITVPTGMTGTIEGYTTQTGTPTPETPIYPTSNGTLQPDDSYLVYTAYKIPVICGGVTTNIYIDEPLTAGETITYNETGVIIPTRTFLNTLSVGTTVQPAKVFIEYVK